MQPLSYITHLRDWLSTDENSIKHSWLISLFCSVAERPFLTLPIYFELSELPRIIISRSFKRSPVNDSKAATPDLGLITSVMHTQDT